MKINKSFYEEFEIDLTGVCNLKCPLCSRNYDHAQHLVYKNVRPLEEIIAQLDTFPNLKRTFLAGQVSEPTTYPKFIEFLKYLKSRNIYIELFTNGNTRTKKFWKEVAEVLDDTDQVHFTVCGSTQELHEKYRVGSKLQQILEHAEIVRSVKPIDYCQFIRFEYNKDDKPDFNFTNFYEIESEGIRLFNGKVQPTDIAPRDTRDKLIKKMYNTKPIAGTPQPMECKSIRDKKIYIDQRGKESPCYVFYEYNPDEPWKYDYTDINNFQFQSCWACTKKCSTLIDKMGLDFVC